MTVTDECDECLSVEYAAQVLEGLEHHLLHSSALVVQAKMSVINTIPCIEQPCENYHHDMFVNGEFFYKIPPVSDMRYIIYIASTMLNFCFLQKYQYVWDGKM